MTASSIPVGTVYKIYAPYYHWKDSPKQKPSKGKKLWNTIPSLGVNVSQDDKHDVKGRGR